MSINSGSARLVLLCPAWKILGTARTVKPGTVVLQSRADDVISFADTEELAGNSGATLIEVGTDHRLADPEPLEAILRACERANKTHRLEWANTTNDARSTFFGPVSKKNVAPNWPQKVAPRTGPKTVVVSRFRYWS